MRISHFTGRLKRPLSLLGVLAAMAGITLLVSRHASLYGQVGPQRIPDLRGEWRGQVTVVWFENSFNPAEQPQFGQDEFTFIITDQNERLFAGTTPDSSPPGDKLTGVLLPDGTVAIQIHADTGPTHGNDRFFLTATLTFTGGRYRMTGYGHGYEDVNLSSQPRTLSLHFNAEKVESDG